MMKIIESTQDFYSMRDEFAIKALQGILMSDHKDMIYGHQLKYPSHKKQACQRAYEIADAMIEARKQDDT